MNLIYKLVLALAIGNPVIVNAMDKKKDCKNDQAMAELIKESSFSREELNKILTDALTKKLPWNVFLENLTSFFNKRNVKEKIYLTELGESKQVYTSQIESKDEFVKVNNAFKIGFKGQKLNILGLKWTSKKRAKMILNDL